MTTSDQWERNTCTPSDVIPWYRCWFIEKYPAAFVIQPKSDVEVYEIWEIPTAEKPSNRHIPAKSWHCSLSFPTLKAAQLAVLMIRSSP